MRIAQTAENGILIIAETNYERALLFKWAEKEIRFTYSCGENQMHPNRLNSIEYCFFDKEKSKIEKVEREYQLYNGFIPDYDRLKPKFEQSVKVIINQLRKDFRLDMLVSSNFELDMIDYFTNLAINCYDMCANDMQTYEKVRIDANKKNDADIAKISTAVDGDNDELNAHSKTIDDMLNIYKKEIEVIEITQSKKKNIADYGGKHCLTCKGFTNAPMIDHMLWCKTLKKRVPAGRCPHSYELNTDEYYEEKNE